MEQADITRALELPDGARQYGARTVAIIANGSPLAETADVAVTIANLWEINHALRYLNP
jgi:DNA-binding MurR/RpiR family transcriptional regulator